MSEDSRCGPYTSMSAFLKSMREGAVYAVDLDAARRAFGVDPADLANFLEDAGVFSVTGQQAATSVRQVFMSTSPLTESRVAAGPIHTLTLEAAK